MFLTTALYAALAALIILALAANVVRLRLRHGVSLGAVSYTHLTLPTSDLV